MKPIHATQSHHKSNTHRKIRASCCGASAERKSKASGLYQMLELRGQAEVFQGMVAREVGLVSLPGSGLQQPTGGQEEGSRTFTFGS